MNSRLCMIPENERTKQICLQSLEYNEYNLHCIPREYFNDLEFVIKCMEHYKMTIAYIKDAKILEKIFDLYPKFNIRIEVECIDDNDYLSMTFEYNKDILCEISYPGRLGIICVLYNFFHSNGILSNSRKSVLYDLLTDTNFKYTDLIKALLDQSNIEIKNRKEGKNTISHLTIGSNNVSVVFKDIQM